MSSRDAGGGATETAVLARAYPDAGAAAPDGVSVPSGRARPLGYVVGALEAERAHWFLWVPVLIGSGIALYFALPYEPPPVLAVLVLAAVVAVRMALATSPNLRIAVDIAGLVAFGFALITLRAGLVDAPILDARIGPVEVRGFVELIEPREGRGERLTLSVFHLEGMDPDVRPQRVRVRTMVRTEGLEPGAAVIVKAHLAPPAAPALPGGFDFARHAYFAGIGAVGYTMSPPRVDVDAPAAPFSLRVAAGVQRLRRAIGARVDRVLAGETAAIAKALVTGERGGIAEATNAAYRDSGLFHILSISGLHMAIMGGAVFFVVRFALALFPAVALRYPVKKWAALAAAGGSLAYLAISGTSFATVRSFIMISIMFLAILLDRPAVALRNVALSALIILLLFPESLLDVGFQMSFAAVVALVAAYEALRSRQGANRLLGSGLPGMAVVFLGGIVLSTVVASVAVTPFAMFHFHKTQHYAVLANLVAVPICNLLVMPAALATLVLMPFGLEAGPLLAMGFGVDAMSATARHVADLPGAVGTVRAISTPAFVLLVAGGLWLTLWQRRWRLLGVAMMAAGLVLAPFSERADVLVGRDGRLVAVRGGDGRLVAVSAAQAQFELKRWLEHDGDQRSAAEAVAASGLVCDSVGCSALVRGVRVSVSRHAASITDDCAMADVLVVAAPAPRGCASPVAVVDSKSVRRSGTHAIYIDGPRRVHVKTVAQERGIRPWAPAQSLDGRRRPATTGDRTDARRDGRPGGRDAGAPQARAGAGAHARTQSGATGVARFSAPLDMLDALRLPRPEVEDARDGEDAGAD